MEQVKSTLKKLGIEAKVQMKQFAEKHAPFVEFREAQMAVYFQDERLGYVIEVQIDELHRTMWTGTISLVGRSHLHLYVTPPQDTMMQALADLRNHAVELVQKWETQAKAHEEQNQPEQPRSKKRVSPKMVTKKFNQEYHK